MPEPTNQDPPERDDIRELLATNIHALDGRIRNQRAKLPNDDTEQLQLQRLRTIAQLAREYRLLARDADVESMQAEIDEIEASLRYTEAEQ
jgi:hypothetical protein